LRAENGQNKWIGWALFAELPAKSLRSQSIILKGEIDDKKEDNVEEEEIGKKGGRSSGP
jgi:hypothetical protein